MINDKKKLRFIFFIYDKPKLLIFCIFILFFSIALIPQLFFPGMSTWDDPYYHVAHANAYWRGTTIEYPSFSALSQRPADLWFLYHVGMAPFTAFFNGNNYKALFIGSKIYHAILTGIFFVLFFLLARTYGKIIEPVYREQKNNHSTSDSSSSTLTRNTTIIGMVSILIAVGLSNEFLFRMLVLARPHILMVSLTLIATWSILRNKKIILFLVSVLAPLFYSFSLFILIPSLGILAAWLLISRNRNLFKFALLPTIISVIGVIAGSLLHPEPYNYIYSAWIILATSIFKAIFQTSFYFMSNKIPMPSELGPAEQLSIPLMLIFPILLIRLFVIILSIKKINADEKQNQSDKNKYALSKAELVEVAFLIIGLGMSFLSIFIVRAVEYSIPFLVISGVTFVVGFLWPRIKQILMNFENRQGEIGDKYKELKNELTPIFRRRALKLTFIALVIVLLVIIPISINVRNLFVFSHPILEYKGAADYITEHNPNGIVFLSNFSDYPRLILFGPTNHYSSGIDPQFAFNYDSKLAWQLNHFIKGETICGERKCAGSATKSGYDVLRDNNISMIFLNDKHSFSKNLLKSVEADARFKNVFSDKQYPNISIIELQ